MKRVFLGLEISFQGKTYSCVAKAHEDQIITNSLVQKILLEKTGEEIPVNDISFICQRLTEEKFLASQLEKVKIHSNIAMAS